MRTLANALAATVLLSAVLIAQSSAGLLDRARREGSLTLYTSLAPTESQPLADAFEKKYGVKVQLWRGQSDEVVQRVVTEAKGRRFAVDVVETNGPEMEMIARERLLGELQSAYVSDLPANAIPAHRTWFPDRMNYFVVGYNTAKVKRGDIPTTYEGFTDPKWKGRIALEATDAEWMATLIKTSPGNKGTDIVRKIAALQPSLRKGHVLLASLVAAGEVPVGLAMYNSNIETLKRKGAPIDYVPVQPVVARPQGIGVARSAPHPNAAILFAEFVLSPDGQQLFESMGRVPASTKIKSEFNKFPFVVIDPVTVLDEAAKWDKQWNELFVRR
ncbi:MAG TPA: extracellular solute-binding protein [Vicinamibacterales bacterium]|nr:extracellular solute-binding protein [Vicinamibacterales bacterium]